MSSKRNLRCSKRDLSPERQSKAVATSSRFVSHIPITCFRQRERTAEKQRQVPPPKGKPRCSYEKGCQRPVEFVGTTDTEEGVEDDVTDFVCKFHCPIPISDNEDYAEALLCPVFGFRRLTASEKQ